MPLKAVINSLEGLDEGTAGLYKPHKLPTGQEAFILDVDPVDGFALEDVTGLKGGLQKERRAHNAAASMLERLGFKQNDEGVWGGSDFDLDDLTKKAQRLAELEKLDPEAEAGKLAEQIAKGQVEQVQAKAAKAQQELQSRYDLVYNQLERNVRRRAISDALADAEAEMPELLRSKLMSETRMVERDGRFITEVLDEKGDARITMEAGSTDPMTVAERVAEMKQQDQYAGAFRGSGRQGMGSNNPGPGEQKKVSHGVRVLNRGDQNSLNENIADIATGKVTVTAN